jgi:hypothetical protein
MLDTTSSGIANHILLSGLALLEGLEMHLGVELMPFRNLCATEWLAESQYELMTGEPDHTPACIFGDITTFYKSELKQQLQSIIDRGGKLDYATLKPVMRSASAVKNTSYCIRHKCECVHQVADVHWAGTPCPDFSILGKGEGLDGPTMVYYTAWCSLRRLLQEACIVQENVEGQPLRLLEETLGDLYYIDEIILDPALLGWPVKRRRVWRLLTHKVKCSGTSQPFDILNKFFHRRCLITWRDFLIAEPAEIDAEKIWSASRPSSKANGETLETVQSLNPIATLTETETQRARFYKRLAPGCVWGLGHNPRNVPIMSDPKILGTVVKNCGIMLADHPPSEVSDSSTCRWFVPNELLTTQAVPVYPAVLGFMGARRKLCSFNFDRTEFGFPPRHSKKKSHTSIPHSTLHIDH